MKLASLLDKKRKRALIARFRRWKAPLGLFLYICGLLGFLALANEDISPRNYVDENALMPGYVANSFGLREASDAILLSQHLKNATSLESLLGMVEESLLDIGLDVHRQRFAAHLPLTGDGGGQGEGVNMYATLRTQRASGIEALVVHVPLTIGSTVEPAFALTLAKFLVRQVVWAKDLIFLFTTGGALGPQAWTEGYMGVENSELTHTQLPSRSGSIQGAITLELSDTAAKKLDISVVGQNGLLPNQDIFNALVAVSKRLSAQLTFDGQADSSTGRYSPRDKYFASLRTILCMVAQQATGLQGGLHGVFVRYHIDAVTIRVPRVIVDSREYTEQAGRVVEGLIRSMNNLLETLHHSLYSYLTVSSDRYLSFTFFLPPLALMLIGPALDSLEQWFIGSDPTLIQHGGGQLHDVSYAQFPVRFICVVFMWATAVGAVMYAVPLVLHHSGLLTPYTLAGSLLASWAVSAAVPTVYRSSVGETEWRLLKFLAMLILIALLFGLSVLNYSLSLVCTAFVSLPSLFARPKPPNGSSLLHLLRLIALLLCSPIVAPLLATAAYHLCYTTSLTASDPLPLLTASVQSLVKGLSEVYTAHWVFHQWLFPVVCYAFTPLWTILWLLCLQRLSEQPKEHLE